MAVRNAKIRVVSFNVFYAFRSRRLEDTIGDIFPRFDPDIIALQEVWEGRKRNFAKRLAETLRYRLLFYPRATVFGRTIGLALLVRGEVEASSAIILPHSHSVHRPRIVQFARIRAHDVCWQIAHTHLEYAGPLEAREGQLATVLDSLASQEKSRSDETPTVFLGDFNTRGDDEIKKFSETLERSGFTPAVAPLYSWKMLGAKGRFDWICAKNCDIVKTGVMEHVKGSDHRPIWADVQYKVSL